MVARAEDTRGPESDAYNFLRQMAIQDSVLGRLGSLLGWFANPLWSEHDREGPETIAVRQHLELADRATEDAETFMGGDMAKLPLLCGILSPLLYIASDIGMAVAYEGYSYLHQTVSELNALGAPTRSLSIGLGFAEYVLLMFFGAGIWMAAAQDRKLQVAAGALLILGAFGFWALPYASMQMRGVRQEGPHLLSGAVGALLVTTAIGFAAAALGNAFRRYSVATIAVMLLFAGWAAMDAGRVERGAPTPWVGVIERVSFYSWHIWFIVLALVLLRNTNTHLATASLRPRERGKRARDVSEDA